MTSNHKTLDDCAGVAGMFWAYDGAFKIGLPPRVYNDALDAIVAQWQADNGPLTPYKMLRVHTIANVAMADSAIAAWREKFKHNFWVRCATMLPLVAWRSS